jgi:hypothetical protein
MKGARPLYAFILILALALSSRSMAQQFVLTPAPPGMGVPWTAAKLVGLPANATVTVKAERVLIPPFGEAASPQMYSSNASFLADASGEVNLGASSALSGSYAGADLYGLLWSMTESPSTLQRPADGSARFEAIIEGRNVASASFQIEHPPADYVVRKVPGFPGSLLGFSRADGPRPVIVIVDGADGDQSAEKLLMPRLAAQGYAVVKFATYSLVFGRNKPTIEGLPTKYVNISIDRLDDLRLWIARQPETDPQRIGVFGISRNATYSLLAAVRYDWIDAVAAIVPSDVVFEGWGQGVKLGTTSSYSWKTTPLPFVPYAESFLTESAKIAQRKPFRLRTGMDEGRWANVEAVAAARIPIERFKGALLLAGGEQDNLWSSGHMVQNMAERRAEAGLSTNFHIFANGGHNLSGDGVTPTMLFESGAARGFEANAQITTWRSMLAFFERALGPKRQSE